MFNFDKYLLFNYFDRNLVYKASFDIVLSELFIRFQQADLPPFYGLKHPENFPILFEFNKTRVLQMKQKYVSEVNINMS